LPFDERPVKSNEGTGATTPIPPTEAEINGAATPLTDNSTKSFY